MIRSPIVVVLGHVDVGKTALLDKIRGTSVMLKEPGTMTQHIGASFLPWTVLKNLSKKLSGHISEKVKIPGLLVIDTPGHEAFTNLRRRGGSIADIAILVVDITKGFQPQTYEALEILRQRKTPFILVANKIDKIPGWKSSPNSSFIINFKTQSESVKNIFEEHIYVIINEMLRQGFRSDLYFRITDFTKTVAIVPTSALTGEGIPDLLLVLAGLTQRYMLKRLQITSKYGKGVVLEVKEEKGLGTTIDTIIYDGIIKIGDTIVVGGLDGAIVTKVKALLMPKPLDEMRAPEDRFAKVKKVIAAAGVKIVANNLEKAITGAPVIVARKNNLREVVKYVEEEVKSIRISKKIAGIVVKADTLGTLEALTNYIEKMGFPVRYADIGPVIKRDIVEASISKQSNHLFGVILAFNVPIGEEAEREARDKDIKIFSERIIYRLVENYIKWYKEEKEKEKKIILSKIFFPAKVKILSNYIFRRSNPIIVGVKVLSGKIKPGYPLMLKDGRKVGEIMQIQEHGKPIKEAVKGMEVAISIRSNMMIGRQIKDDDTLYTDIPEYQLEILLEKFKEEIGEEEMELIREIKRIRRKLYKGI